MALYNESIDKLQAQSLSILSLAPKDAKSPG